MGWAAARRVESVWRRAKAGETRRSNGADRTLDRIALNALGIATEELREVLPRFDDFDDLVAWSEARRGGLDHDALGRFEAVVAGEPRLRQSSGASRPSKPPNRCWVPRTCASGTRTAT